MSNGEFESTRPGDALAVTIGNASLLGVGYWLLRRRLLAVTAVLITAALIAVLGTGAVTATWFEFVLVGWWAALVGHGWWLARRRGVNGTFGQPDGPNVPFSTRIGVGWQRTIAIAVTVPMLVAIGLVRDHAEGIGRTVADARQQGDCARALAELKRVDVIDRTADAPLAVSDDRTGQACRRLNRAAAELTTGLRTGKAEPLTAGFTGLDSVLADLPGHEQMVTTVLNRFLSGLPTQSPCRTVTIAKWLGARRPTHDTLNRAVTVAARTGPPARLDCGNQHLAANDWPDALTSYRQLLALHPDRALAARAEQGVRRTIRAQDLAHMQKLLDAGDQALADKDWTTALTNYRRLLAIHPDPKFAGRAEHGAQRATQGRDLARIEKLLGTTSDDIPTYCSHPAAYPEAPAYQPGLNRALFYTADGYRFEGDPTDDPENGAYADYIPDGWSAGGPTDASLVVCLGTEHHGPAVDTCDYTDESDSTVTLTFDQIAVPVQVYELRTGHLVQHTTVEIGGTACQQSIEFELTPLSGSETWVIPHSHDVQAAFRPIITK